MRRYGAVLLPDDARDPEGAMRLADQRLYEAKQSGRRSPSRQSTDVLLQALRERDPDLGSHLHDVGGLTAARCQAASGSTVDEHRCDPPRRRAARHRQGRDPRRDPLQGGTARPGRVGNRPSAPARSASESSPRRLRSAGREARPLEPRAISTAPAIRRAWRSDEIPLGSRIMAVCDAFDAMIGPRPVPARHERGRCARRAAALCRDAIRCRGSSRSSVRCAPTSGSTVGTPGSRNPPVHR